MIEILKVAIKFAIAVLVMRFYGGLINFILKRVNKRKYKKFDSSKDTCYATTFEYRPRDKYILRNKEKKEENNNNV